MSGLNVEYFSTPDYTEQFGASAEPLITFEKKRTFHGVFPYCPSYKQSGEILNHMVLSSLFTQPRFHKINCVLAGGGQAVTTRHL